MVFLSNKNQDEGGYVLLHYRTEEERRLLGELLQNSFELVKKAAEKSEFETDEDSGNDTGERFKRWGSNYSGKSKESVYEFMSK